MITYSKQTDFESFKAKAGEELTKMFIGASATSKTYGVGQILKVDLGNIDEDTQELDVYAEIMFKDVNKTFSIRIALEKGSLEFDATTLENFKKVFEELQSSVDLRVSEINNDIAQKAEQDRLAKEARELELKKQKEELKFKLKKERALKKLEELKPENTKKLFETPMSHYEVLGWMAKHITSIKPAMPDYMEPWFVSIFGDVNRTVVDSRKKTVNGFPMQWGLSCRISFNQNVVGPLEARATSKNKKAIDNVAFVWDLIDNYGFNFGKEQNLDKIIEEVPSQYLEDFQRGYAM